MAVGALALVGVLTASEAAGGEGALRSGGAAADTHATRARAAAQADERKVCGALGAKVTGPGVADTYTPNAEEAASLNQELQAQASPQRYPSADDPITIPVVVHVISTEQGAGSLDRSTVREQIDVMNEGFSGALGGVDTGMRFQLRDVTRTTDDAWFNDFEAHEREAKSELRRGDAGVLNLYSVDMADGVLGRATFPQKYQEDPTADGVVIDYQSVPGGASEGFNLGHTAVHETGHWIGLFHTFQNGCRNPGDYVDDTAYEREQATGCPEGRDTCPEKAGDDPVHNFMDYSDDACLSEFTRGQANRMAHAWSAFRE